MTYLTDGNWRIVGHKGIPEFNGEIGVYLQHRCTARIKPEWNWFNFHHARAGGRCTGCLENSPEGMVAALWFLRTGA